MPKDNDISNDELIMDEEIQPEKNNFDNNSQIFSSTYKPNKKRRPVIPFLLGFLASMALFIGLCFVSGWFAFGLLASAGLFVYTIKNNDYNNLQKSTELQQHKHSNKLDIDSPVNDLVVENAINKSENLHLNANKIKKQQVAEGNKLQKISDIKNSEKQSFTSNFNANTANKKDIKFNSSTKTNLDLINRNGKEQNEQTIK